MRERFFTPRLRVSSYEELNGLLLDHCVAYAKAHKHPEIGDRTIWQAFEAERAHLVPVAMTVALDTGYVRATPSAGSSRS